jgi:hypothetical protein
MKAFLLGVEGVILQEWFLPVVMGGTHRKGVTALEGR